MLSRLSSAGSSQRANSFDTGNTGSQTTGRTSNMSSSKGEGEDQDDAAAQGNGETVNIQPEDLEDGQEDASQSGKFKQLLSILRKTLNVKDLTSVRISLPATLLEPLANLEYWQYVDRPDFFAAIAAQHHESDDLDRMLAVLRWMFTKDLKFVKGGIKKPFNSILGEHFLCHWDVPTIDFDDAKRPVPRVDVDEAPSKEVLSAAGIKEYSAPSTSATSSSSAAATHRIAFVNCQTSHHPPISHFWVECRPVDDIKGKGRVIARGADHLSAKFTGTNVKVQCGPSNKGIFVDLPDLDEEYQITHPTAVVAGLLRGSPYATVCDYTYVTSRSMSSAKDDSKTRYRAIIHYQEESWLLKPRYLVDGIVYKYEAGSPSESFTKPKQVPADQIVAHIEGCWRGEIRYRLANAAAAAPSSPSKKDSSSSSSPSWNTLVNLVQLNEVAKTVAPVSEQDELESRRVWAPVIEAIERKDFSKASKAKQQIEQKQRDKAAERKANGVEYKPVYFEQEGPAWDGRPTLTDEGKRKLEMLFDRPLPSS